MLKSLSKSHELSHCLSLELFNVFVLLFQLTVSTVLECTEFERFVCAFVVNLLLQVVLAIVNFLHDILFSFDTRLNFAIELILETIQCVLSLVNLFVCFSYTVVNFLLDGRLQTIKSLLRALEFNSVMLTHSIDLAFEFLTEHAQFVLKLGSEGLQSVIDSLRLCLGEVTIGLDLALNVLELGLQLFLRLNPLHEHHVVISVHLDQLVVHSGQWDIIILLTLVACHIFLNQFLLWFGDSGLHDCVACCNKCA